MNSNKQRLGTTFILVIVAVLSITMGATTYIRYQVQHKQAVEDITEKGRSFSSFISLIISDAILSSDFLLMNQYMKELANVQDVVFGTIAIGDKINLTSYLNKNNEYVKKYKSKSFSETIKNIKNDNDIVTLEYPVVSNENNARVIVGISTKRAAEISNEYLVRQLIESIIIMVILSLAIYFVFRIKTLKPIRELVTSFKIVEQGDLDSRAPIASSKELAELGDSFNQMTKALLSSQQEKVQALAEIISANEQLEAATKAKSAFLANMSHEIRTPLTSIVGFGQALLDEQSESIDRDDAIYSIIRNGKHLQHIINDILDLSKIEAEKLEIEELPVSLFELLHDVSLLIDIQGREKGLSTYINHRYPLPKTIYSDPVRIKQILINLCNNAIKFTESGSVSVDVAYDKFNNRIKFDVIDTGIGLDQEQQQKIFEAFSQADSSTTRKYGGTGLGLSLSKQLANMLGGDITVESKPGEGSKFSISISAGEEELEFVHRQTAVHSVTPPKETKSDVLLDGHILLAEDMPDNQVLISLYIKRMGLSVTVVNNGKEAVEAVNENDFDLVFMDMQMPIMGGVEAVEILRSQNFKKPIIALTANAMKEDRDKCLAAGCQDFLTKPIDTNNFYNLLKNYLTTKESSLDEANLVLPNIDVRDEEMFNLTKIFVSRLPSIIKNINETFENRELLKLKELTHDLKGTAGSFGYPKLSSICQDIQVEIFNTCKNSNSCELTDSENGEIVDAISDLIDELNATINLVLRSWDERYSNAS